MAHALLHHTTVSLAPGLVSFKHSNKRTCCTITTRKATPVSCPIKNGRGDSRANVTKLGSNRRRNLQQRMVARAAKDIKYTEEAQKAIKLAQEEVSRHGFDDVGTEHILLGLLAQGTGAAAELLKASGLNLNDARAEVDRTVLRSSRSRSEDAKTAKLVLEDFSLIEARRFGQETVGTVHLLLALLRVHSEEIDRVLTAFGAAPRNIKARIIQTMGGFKTPTLDAYSVDLTRLARQGKVNRVVRRQEQVEQVIKILGRLTKNNPVLIVEPGVEDTTIAEGVAQRIAEGDVSRIIQGKKIVKLDMVRLFSVTPYNNQDILKKIVEEIKQSNDIILLVDKLHTVLGGGRSLRTLLEGESVLRPAIAKGEIQVIGVMTLDKFKEHIEQDSTLEKMFQVVKIPELTVDEAIEMLRSLRQQFERHHELRYTDEALVAAAQLSHQYIPDRPLPDKAIDVIDDAGARVRLRHDQIPEKAKELEKELQQVTKEKREAVKDQNYEKALMLRDREIDITVLVDENKRSRMVPKDDTVVTEVDIQQAVSSLTGIPIDVSSNESDMLLKMEDTLHTRIVGQDEAVGAISRSIRRARVGLKNPNRPIASFIFSGPTGVGKSELAKALANYYFKSEKAMIRFDMSEYVERHTISRLIGSPPGYVGYSEGGQLTNAVRQRPYSLILFDEIEKAHPVIFNMMLQILEDGRLTDGQRRTVDFKNTLVIMTSNVGSNVIENGGRRIGFDLDFDDEKKKEEKSYARIKSQVIDELKHHFRPEFLNRLDDMIVFRQLTRPEVKEIADIMLKEVFERLKVKKIEVEATERFMERVVEEGYDPSYGARPLRRAISRLVEDCMAEKMLGGEIKGGDSVVLDVDSQDNVVAHIFSAADRCL